MSEWRYKLGRKLASPKYGDDFGYGAWPGVATIRLFLSRWLGIGQWFQDGKDRCWRCGGEPSDMDFMMRRVRPFRAECLDREGCEDEALWAARSVGVEKGNKE